MDVVLPANHWQPRFYQMAFWQYMQMTPWGARAILCHHRRAGKDHCAINWTAVASQQRVGLYIHIFPYLNQGRRIIWEGIDRDGHKFLDAFPPDLIAGTSDLEMRIDFKNGSVYRVMGADDPDKLVGINCVGATFSEYALMDPRAYQLIVPILNENGGWAIFPSTPRGENHFHDLIYGTPERPGGALANKRWFVSIATVDDTGAVDPALIEEDRKQGIEEAIIQQEYWCSFKGVQQGAYYAEQMQALTHSNRITLLPVNPQWPVNTVWDFGVDDCTAIIFYQRDDMGSIRVVDYYEASGKGLAFYVNELNRRQLREGYSWGRHNGPHDLRQRSMGATVTTKWQTLKELGFVFHVIEKSLCGVSDGIEAVRQVLSRTYFDEANTRRLVTCLKSYRREYDPKTKAYRNTPLHDEYSHGADAFRYLAVAERTVRSTTRVEQPLDVPDYDPLRPADAVNVAPQPLLRSGLVPLRNLRLY